MINGLDLFSGIGGISEGLKQWVRPVAYCENDRYAQGVLLSRMCEDLLPYAPIWDDIRTLKGKYLPVKPDIIYGGFPCQDISVAGNGAGLGGKRSGLFFEIMRLVTEIKPTFIFLENVPAITSRGLGEVTAEITKRGYDCRWTIVSAAEVGAPHLRKRWFLLAHTRRKSKRANENLQSESKKSVGEDASELCGSVPYSNSELLRNKQITKQECESKTELTDNGEAKHLADTNGEGLQGHSWSNRSRVERRQQASGESLSREQFWAIEPDVGRVANGVSNRMDKLKCLGNAVVPIQAEKAFKELMGIK